MTAPAYLPAPALAASIAMIAATLHGLDQALVGASWFKRGRTWVLRAATVLSFGWFAAALALAPVGVYEGARHGPPA